VKILNKICLILIIIGQSSVDANFYGVVNVVQKAGFHFTGISRAALALGYTLRKCHQIASFPDAGSEVFDFCKSRCEKQNVDIQNLKVKIDESDGTIIEVVGRQSIVFSATNYNELQQALKNPQDEVSRQVILIYAFLVDHEIGHIKSNDAVKRNAFLVGSNLLVYAGSHYVMNHTSLKTWFKPATNFKEFIISAIAFGCVKPLFAANDYVYSLYAQDQETAADYNAIKYADNPESLRLAASYFEKLDESYINVLCGTQEINPSFSWIVKAQFENVRKILETQYQSQKITEDFRAWVKKQTKYLNLVRSIADQEHPSGIVRGKAIRAAADKLEADQLGSNVSEVVCLN
jgi:hypothetical protein